MILADQKYTEESSFYGHEPKHLLISFDPNVCGTADELRKNQKYIERYNYSVQIRKMLEEDFKNQRNKVLDSVKEMITKNIRNLCIQHLQGQLVSCSKQYTFDSWYDNNRYPEQCVYFCYGYRYNFVKAEMRCYFTGTKPSVVIRISPQNIAELLEICNCNKEDLPEETATLGYE